MMRRFTAQDEQALLFLLDAPGATWRALPLPKGLCPYNRLAARGLAQVMVQGPLRRGRLTLDGRYFATLLRESGLVICDPPGMIGERTLTA